MKLMTQQMRALTAAAAVLLSLLLLHFLGPPALLRAQACSATMTVANQTELDAAITCFNGQTTAGTYQITLTADITLTSSTTTIDNGTAGIDLLIDGAGFTVDGGGTLGLRVFEVAAGSDVTMQEITITGGNRLGSTGGGILNAGSLAIYDSTLHNNQAGFGGAINSSGTLNVERSTFSGNSAVLGAAIDSNGSLTINNSTFSGNGDSASGGTAVDATGGSISSSTFYSNSSNPSSAAVVDYLPGASLTLTNNVFVRGSSGANCAVFQGGSIIDGGGNISDDATCVSAGNSLASTDPQLNSTLADNGGPTQTHTLLPGSPALSYAVAGFPATDQRGLSRPQGAAADSGAFEADCVFPVNVAGEAAMNEAIGCFNAQSDAGTYWIFLTADFTPTAFLRTFNNATAGVELIIEGGGHVVDVNEAAELRPFTIARNSVVTMRQLTLTGSRINTFLEKGPIDNSGTLTLERCVFTDNRASVGSVVANDGTLIVSESTFSNNQAAIGGAIDNLGTLNVTASTFDGNQSIVGGAISNARDLTIDNSTFSANSVMPGFGYPGDGQAVYTSGGSISSSTFYQNDSSAGSAAVTVSSGAVTLSNNVFVKGANSANCFVEPVPFPGSFSDGGGNVSDDASCPTSAGSLSNTTTLLGGLTDNGGLTRTHALLTGSQAIDFIPITSANSADRLTATCPGLDQRGFERGGGDGLGGDACDSGAFEYDSAEPTAITLRVFEARPGGFGAGTPLAALFMSALLLTGWVVRKQNRNRVPH